jgi:AcrR family transcriptional regulator
MPKQTFFNLPEEKRKHIETAALNEFAEYGYDASNMNRIVEQSNIAKGSFYQYFEDKKDLYFHLLNAIAAQKFEIIENVMKGNQGRTFSQNIEAAFEAGLAYADSNPKLYKLGEDFVNMQKPFMLEFIRKYNPAAIDIYSKLLNQAHENCELYDGINIALTSSFISSAINQTSLSLINQATTKDSRDGTIRELISFIERAVLKPR